MLYWYSKMIIFWDEEKMIKRQLFWDVGIIDFDRWMCNK